MDFLLKNKDKDVLRFSVKDMVVSEQFSIDRVISPELMPLDFSHLDRWLEDRYSINYRENVFGLFHSLGLTKRSQILSATNCVSLKDTFWVCEANSKMKWASVNPFTNSFNKMIADYAFGRKVTGKYITASPDFATDGNFPKCWVRENGQIVLAKAAGVSGHEPYSEIYSYKVAEILKLPAEKYWLGVHKGERVSKCRCFTTEKTGFIAYKDLHRGKLSSSRELVAMHKEMGLDNHFRGMLLLDFLTLNTDRHLGNFGYLFDSDTMEVLGLSPIYDNNLSFAPNYHMQDDFDEYMRKLKTSDGTSFEELWTLIGDRHLIMNVLSNENAVKKISLGYKRDSVVQRILNRQIDYIKMSR